MAYEVLKEYPEHNFKVGEVVGMNDKFAKKLLKDGIIKSISGKALEDKMKGIENGN